MKTYIFNGEKSITAKSLGEAIKYYYANHDALITIECIETTNEYNDTLYID